MVYFEFCKLLYLLVVLFHYHLFYFSTRTTVLLNIFVHVLKLVIISQNKL